jgi:hypothetical protein
VDNKNYVTFAEKSFVPLGSESLSIQNSVINLTEKGREEKKMTLFVENLF